MKWIALAVLIAIVVVVAAVLVRLKAGKREGVWPFYAKKPLTQPEQVLYFRLVTALPDYIVLAQVQLSRFLGVKKGANAQSWLNRINRMSADFVICHKDATVLAAIELDDVSHQRKHRVTADAKKGKALAAAGIKLVRWQVRELPDEYAIRSALLPGPADPAFDLHEASALKGSVPERRKPLSVEEMGRIVAKRAADNGSA